MSKIPIGFTAVLTLFTVSSFATNSSTSKNEVSIPCYNGGFSFGLAGLYSNPSNGASELNNGTNEVNSPDSQEYMAQEDYQ